MDGEAPGSHQTVDEINLPAPGLSVGCFHGSGKSGVGPVIQNPGTNGTWIGHGVFLLWPAGVYLQKPSEICYHHVTFST
jgi:hypothetical protein